MNKLGTIALNGKPVTVFKPPHSEPDFPWIDVEELAGAWLSPAEAKAIVKMTHKYNAGSRPYTVVRNGSRVATIVCHALAQGVCGSIDHKHGWAGYEDESGPVATAYATTLAAFAKVHWPLPLEDMLHAFQNPGGKFLRESGR